jgi:Glycosyltransferase family 87
LPFTGILGVVSFIRPLDVPVGARRWRLAGFIGVLLMAVAATGVGARPANEVLGDWPALPWPTDGTHPAVTLAYLGLMLMIGAWWRLGTVLHQIPDRLWFVARTMGMWAVPLALAPPLYSRDVYSYLAQGTMYASGLDPYRAGPSALGGALASNVSPIWLHTPAPYGPVFLAVASAVTSTTGSHIVAAVIGMRVVMIASMAVTAACLVPLAKRFGVDPASAVWLGALNPLVLTDIVSGAHNDGLMLMLMTGGILLAVKNRPILAAAVLGLAVLVKVPALAAIIVVIPSMARQLHGRWRMLRGGLAVAATALGTILVVTFMMGAWYGWVAALSDTARVRNGLSVSTDLGIVADSLAWTVGTGTGTVDIVSVSRALGVLVAAALGCLVLARTRGKPLYALGLIMSAVVLLGPVVHPWYLLWGVVPLAASTRDPRVVTKVALLSAVLALYPMPWGEGFSDELIWGLYGIGAALLVLGAVRPRHPSVGSLSFDPGSSETVWSHLVRVPAWPTVGRYGASSGVRATATADARSVRQGESPAPVR